MEMVLLIIIAVLQAIMLVQAFLAKRNDGSGASRLEASMSDLQKTVSSSATELKNDFSLSRQEVAGIARENREELGRTLDKFSKDQEYLLRDMKHEQKESADGVSGSLDKVSQKVEEKLKEINDRARKDSEDARDALVAKFKSFEDFLGTGQKQFSESTAGKLNEILEKIEKQLKEINDLARSDSEANRKTLSETFDKFGTSFEKSVGSFNELQQKKFEELGKKQSELVQSTEKKLEGIRTTVEEKLEKTLSERLGQSFETVGKQLNEVQKGLGEMQVLAQDVGSLKKVLGNVKMRGGIGEVQLAMLLEQILAPDQYESNVKTKTGSSDLVEFAVKLPGKDDDGAQVWLPIDAKFPKDVYEKLQEAYDHGDTREIDAAQKGLDATIRKMAGDIRDKYIDPPQTTDFAILFLPFEGIYAEVVRKASLLEELQVKYKVVVTGPTTLAAILNSLHIGFRTLAIQKRSSEVWRVLGAVKTEFSKFSGLMQKAQKNIQTGLNQLDGVVGTRTRAIQRTLKGVEALDAADSGTALSLVAEDEEGYGDE